MIEKSREIQRCLVKVIAISVVVTRDHNLQTYKNCNIILLQCWFVMFYSNLWPKITKMINTGREEARTTWLPNGLERHGGPRRIRSS